MANRLRVYWPGDQLCNSCFYTAMRTHGICPSCGHDGVLPGRLNHTDQRPVCVTCAGIPGDYCCRNCGAEGEMYRRRQCARCALRDDLTVLIVEGAADPSAMATIVEIPCGVERPESILTWKRSPTGWALLKALACGDIPLTMRASARSGAAATSQPLTKIVALKTTAIVPSPREMRISLGAEPVPVPAPFAGMLSHYLRNRPNPRTGGGMVANPWLFPGYHPGTHLDPQSIMQRLRKLGVNLLSGRNSALQNLVAEVPPPLVAELLGYSYQVTQRHAELAAQPWSRYVT
jgi:hypothetical protein